MTYRVEHRTSNEKQTACWEIDQGIGNYGFFFRIQIHCSAFAIFSVSSVFSVVKIYFLFLNLDGAGLEPVLAPCTFLKWGKNEAFFFDSLCIDYDGLPVLLQRQGDRIEG
jgi:hypothetical protein